MKLPDRRGEKLYNIPVIALITQSSCMFICAYHYPSNFSLLLSLPWFECARLVVLYIAVLRSVRIVPDDE